jgi:hypothetical protein
VSAEASAILIVWLSVLVAVIVLVVGFKDSKS